MLNASGEGRVVFVKQKAGLLKAARFYEMLASDKKEVLYTAAEKKAGLFVKILRFTSFTTLTPFYISITDHNDTPVLSLHKKSSFLRAQLQLLSAKGDTLMTITQPFLGTRRKFKIDSSNEYSLEGNLSGLQYKLLDGKNEIACIKKAWAGVAKELFTDIDYYKVRFQDDVPNSTISMVFALVVALDSVYKS